MKMHSAGLCVYMAALESGEYAKTVVRITE